MVKNRFLYALSGCLCAAGFLLPAPAQSKSLNEAILLAWANHPTLEATRASQGYANSDLREQVSAYYPTLNASANAARLYGDNSTTRGLSVTRGAGYSGSWEASTSLSQTLSDGGRRRSQYNAAEIRTRAARHDLTDAKDLLANSVAGAYVDLLRVYQGLAMLAEHRVRIDDYVGRIKASVDEGAADEAEYQQAQDMSLALSSLLSDYKTQLRSAEAIYFDLVGEMPEGDMTRPLVAAELLPADFDVAFEQARDANAALQSAILNAKSIEQEIEAEKAAYYPTFASELSYLKSEKKDMLGGEAIDARASVRMNWSFETGGGVQARVAKTTYRYKESLARVRELEQQIERSIRLSYAEYGGAKDQLQLQNERKALSENLFGTMENQFEGARISLLQLMQSENQLFMAQLDNVNAQNRVLLAQYAILSSMGSVKDLPGLQAEAEKIDLDDES